MEANETLLVDLEKILTLSTVHLYWLDKNNVYQGCNDLQAKSAGLASRFDIVGKTNSDLPWNKGQDDLVEKVDRLNLLVLKTGEAQFAEEQAIDLTGRKRIFLSHKLPLKNQLGEVIGIFGISIDITNQKMVQEKLQHEKEQAEFTLEHIVANLPAHVYWKNKDGIYLGCNDLQARSIGLESSHDIVGKTDFDLPGGRENAEKLRANDLEVIQTGQQNTIEERSLVDGVKAIVLSHKLPLRMSTGDIAGIVGISIDITDRKKMEEELRVAKEHAELANEIKTQFIQNMQHDLRTPASGVAQMLHNLVAQEKDASKKAELSALAKSSQRLLDFLNSILTFSKIGVGSAVMAHKFDLHDAIMGVIDMETPTALHKKLELLLKIADNVPQNIIGDRYRMTHILLNLVSNAVKFTNKGYVKVEVNLAKQINARDLLLQLKVTDTGIGIQNDKINHIYECFERGTPSNRGLYPGLGLGLSIVKYFIAELNGEIEVVSDEGRGSIFTCLLPCSLSLMDINSYEGVFPVANAVAAATSSATTKDLDFSRLQILVVEDDEVAQMAARNVFAKQLGANFVLAKTGKEAIDQVAAKKYDIVFMDLGLPDIIGTDVSQELRKIGCVAPIVALTAHDDPEVRRICRRVGINDFLVKPINVDKARAIAEKWLSHDVQIIVPEDDLTALDDTKVLDAAACKKLVIDDDYVKEVWKVLAGLLPSYLNDLQECYEGFDTLGLHHLSHKLVGAAACAGAPRLQIAATALRDLTYDMGIEMPAVTDLYNGLCAAIKELLQEYVRLGIVA